jgi:hypothetical protein
VLGRVDPQGSLLAPGQLVGDVVGKGSFYDKPAAWGHELITDDDFARCTPRAVDDRRSRRR